MAVRKSLIRISFATDKSFTEMLEGVVQNGTAQSLKKSPFKIAGKTGTAQIAQPGGGYNKTNYNASFVGYFPADDPKYVYNPINRLVGTVCV